MGLETTSLADPTSEPDRTAPIPFGMEAGVGSGASPPRIAASAVAEIGSQSPMGSAPAEFRRILGRALASTTAIGGRSGSRPPVRHANALQRPGFHSNGDQDRARKANYRPIIRCAQEERAVEPIPQLTGIRVVLGDFLLLAAGQQSNADQDRKQSKSNCIILSLSYGVRGSENSKTRGCSTAGP